MIPITWARGIGRIWEVGFFVTPTLWSAWLCSLSPRVIPRDCTSSFPTVPRTSTRRVTQLMVPEAGMAEMFARERFQGTLPAAGGAVAMAGMSPVLGECPSLYSPLHSCWQSLAAPLVRSAPASGSRCSISALRDKKGVKNRSDLSVTQKQHSGTLMGRGHVLPRATKETEALKIPFFTEFVSHPPCERCF